MIVQQISTFAYFEHAILLNCPKTIVMAMDPVAALGLIGNADLTDNAVQVRAKMEQMLDTLSDWYR